MAQRNVATNGILLSARVGRGHCRHWLVVALYCVHEPEPHEGTEELLLVEENHIEVQDPGKRLVYSYHHDTPCSSLHPIASAFRMGVGRRRVAGGKGAS